MKEDAGKFFCSSLEMESLLTGYHDSAMSLYIILNYLSQNNIIEFLFLENALHLSKIMRANMITCS